MKKTIVLLVLVVLAGIGGLLKLGAGDDRVTAREKASTRLYVRTVPPGAAVKIDGKPSGTSDRLFEMPHDVKRVLIEVELDGRDEQKEVIVRGGRIMRVEFDLRAQAKTDAHAAKATATPGASRLIGRTTVHGDDVGVVFHYELGKPLVHETIQQHVPVENIPRTRGVQITLTGSLDVPEKMTVVAWQAGGSSTGGVHRLYVDGKEVGSIGDDRIKNTVYRLELGAGAHPVQWVLTGGDFGPCVLQFVDFRTKRPLRVTVSEAEEAAAKKPPMKKEVDNFSAKPLPLPADILNAKADPTPKTPATNEAAAAGRVSTAGLTPDEDGWIALAPLVRADRDLKDAGWKWDGRSAAFSAGRPRAVVSIPVRIAGSYELQTRVTITRAKETTAICLPISGTRAVVLDMKGDRGNSESPTATIRLIGLKPEPQPQDNASMKIGTEYALSCKVLAEGNKVTIEIRRDGRVLFQWAGDVAQVAQRSLMRPGTVQLETAYYTTSRFTDLRLKMLSGQAALIKEAAAAGPSRLIGRTTVHGDDVGVVFHYELGKPLTHKTIQQHVPVENIPRTRGVQIALTGSLDVPEKMTVLAWQAGGSPTGGVHRLYVDGKEVGSIGDDRIKNTVYRLKLDAGAHPVQWVLTGGDFGPCVLQFVDLRTKRALRVTVSEAEEAAAKKPPMKKEVDNFSAEPLPLPKAILDAGADGAVLTKPPGEFQVDYAGLRWDLWRTGWEVEDGKLASQRYARPGFRYGHGANGRGGIALTGHGDKNWVDYEVAFDYKMLPANREFFHAHIPGDSRRMSVAFRIKSISESWNQPHTCYSFGLGPTGTWSMGVSEDYHMPGHGWSAERKGKTEKLASGKSESCKDASEGRLRLRVKGDTITVWLNDEKLVEHTHKGEVVDPIPYGGFGVQWRYESMGWISNLQVKKL